MPRLYRAHLAKWIALFGLALLLVIQFGSRPVAAIEVGDVLSELLSELESRTGYTLTRDLFLTNTAEDRARFLGSDADVYARAVQVVGDPDTGWRDAIEVSGGMGLATRWDGCLIIYTPRLLRLSDPRDQSMALAHELAHCYQYDRMGDLRALPDWLREGSAEWMAQNIVESPTFGGVRWRQYLTEAVPLLGRSYDAMGLLAHFAYQGIDVWNLLDRFFSADDLPFLSDEMLERLLTLSGSRDRLLQTWPMSLERDAGAGRDWDTSGPAITSDRRASQTISVPGSAPIGATNQFLWDLDIPSGQIVTVNVSNGYGAIRWGRNTETFSGSFSKRYCVGDSCQCEDGSAPPGVESVETSQALLAATADLTPGNLQIEVEAPPDCERDEPSSGGGSGSAADGATGSSYGDPHMITYDGYRYSFQTVGEFLLSQSRDGHFVVQARQSQVPGQNALSLNTAVAMKVGNHRVAIYAQSAPDGRTPLWIDGNPTPLQDDTLTLSGGGSVRQYGSRYYTVNWPTGEQVAIKGIESGGAEFLNISPTLPRTAAGQTLGLLGDFNGNAGDDLRGRNGQLVPSQDAYAPVTQLVSRAIDLPVPLSSVQNAFFEQLYRQFGDSWRLAQADSLFDYAPGQSTETFTNRAFPDRFPSLVGIAPDQIQAATRLCREAEVTDLFLEGCVFDVAVTGQPGFAQAAAEAVAMAVVDQVRDRVVEEVREEVQERIPIPIPRWPF